MWSFLKKHSLGIVLGCALLLFMAYTVLLGPDQWREERDLDASAPITSEYWEWWTYNTALSLEADIFGALLLVLLTKKLFEKGSAESKDPDSES